jgi:hypothetical protein
MSMPASPDEILAMVCFARVVEARSFTRAAALLGVSKSVVSARVAALEQQLKVRLLHRTTRKLALTPDGLALYQRCAPLLAAADEAAAAARGTGDTPRGTEQHWRSCPEPHRAPRSCDWAGGFVGSECELQYLLHRGSGRWQDSDRRRL